MTANQVKNLIHLIQAYFPTIKIADNEIEILVWESEFADLDNDLVVEATKNVCRSSNNCFSINIGEIKKECLRLKNIYEEQMKIHTNPNSIPMPDNIKKQMIKDGLL